jgi:hypothetical protein
MNSKPYAMVVLASLIGVGLVSPVTLAAGGSGGDPTGSGGSDATTPGGSAPQSTTVDLVISASTPSTLSSVAAVGGGEATILTYLDALDTVDASPALAVASPRSAAWRYAEHQVAYQEASRENGFGASTNEVTPVGDGSFQVCSGTATQSCSEFADFTTDSAGLISAFTVNGADITPRLGDPSDPATFGQVTAQVRSSYHTTTSDLLIVVVEVAVPFDFVITSVAQYTDPAGDELEGVDALIPPTFSAGPASTIALAFPASDPGGRVVWEMSPAEGGDPTVIDLVVPALLTGAELAVPPVVATTQPGSQGPTTTTGGMGSQMIAAWGPTLAASIGAGGIVEPDATCLDAAIEALAPSVRETVDQLVDDPSLFDSLDDVDAEVIALAYLGCVEVDLLPLSIAAVTTRLPVENLPCVAEAWADVVTAQVVASSIAYSHGLDDLPTETVDQLTLTAAACVPDRQWWIDDEALILEQGGWDPDQASCIATAVVDTLGVGPIIKRRVLTVPFYPVTRGELEGVDFSGRCDIELGDPPQLGPPGTCLAGFGRGRESTQIVGCEQPHNAEVITVTDLSILSTWPGAQALREGAADLCAADVEALSGDLTRYAAGWDIPGRLAWEQSDRVLTCSLIHYDYSSWTGPSGLVPTASEASIPASSPEAPPPTTTIEPVATAPTTSVSSATAPTSPSSAPPALTPGEFDVEMPAVEGYTYSVIPTSSIPSAQLDLPGDVDGVAFEVSTAGASIGSIVVVDDFGLPTYLDQLFDAPVLIELDSGSGGDETLVPANDAARAVWQPFSGMPVIAATLPDDDRGQWVWGHDGRIWIAVGSLAMEGLVSGVIAQQQAEQQSDPLDYRLLAGPLYGNWLQAVPGYLFVDLAVPSALEQIPNTLAGDCAQRFYLGNVTPVDDPNPLTMTPDDLAVAAATIGGVCADLGFFDDLDDALDAMGLRDDVIAGIPVRRDDTNIVVVDGNDVIHLSSSDPATLVEMQPFISHLVTRQRNPEVVDFNTLAVGTCLFRGAQRSDDPEDRPVHVVDCATPHHGEVFHVLDFESPPDATYPGDAPISTLADQLCVDAFADYVGVDFASSRLNFLYFYPSAETWAIGDRAVTCILYGSDPEELIRGSVAQTAQ